MTRPYSPSSLPGRLAAVVAIAVTATFGTVLPAQASTAIEASGQVSTSGRFGTFGTFGPAVSERLLDRIRGGFALPNVGTALTVDVRQSVYVNDALAGTSTLRLTQQDSRLSVEASPAVLVQLGAGNGFTPGTIGANAAATIVQNSLDNQSIRTVTQIDISATMLRAYRDLALQSTLNGAIVQAVRH